MSEMVERVARAIETEIKKRRPDEMMEPYIESAARAAVEVMRPAISAAYVRGVEWNEENPLDREYRFKAAADYADKATSPPPDQYQGCR